MSFLDPVRDMITIRHIYQFVSQRKRKQGNDEKWEQKKRGKRIRRKLKV